MTPPARSLRPDRPSSGRGGLRLGVEPGLGPDRLASSAESFRRKVAGGIAEYTAAFDRGDLQAASDHAGYLAVLLEERDHPDALSWWGRRDECQTRAEHGFTTACDIGLCTETATFVVPGVDFDLWACDRHATSASHQEGGEQ